MAEEREQDVFTALIRMTQLAGFDRRLRQHHFITLAPGGFTRANTGRYGRREALLELLCQVVHGDA